MFIFFFIRNIEKLDINDDKNLKNVQTLLIEEQHNFNNIFFKRKDNNVYVSWKIFLEFLIKIINYKNKIISYTNFCRNAQSHKRLSNLCSVDDNIKSQTCSSKSLPNTPKNEEIQDKEQRIRASSAIENIQNHTKEDFCGLDAYLEKKLLEKCDDYSECKNYDNNMGIYNETINCTYSCNYDSVDSELFLLASNLCSNNSACNIQNEEILKLSLKQREESFLSSPIFTNVSNITHKISSDKSTTG